MKKIVLALSLFVWITTSCEEETNPTFDTENFTAIFDSNQFSATFNPIDFKQTADGGYLILGTRELSESDFRGIYLMKADKFGNFVGETEVDEQFVHPTVSLTEVAGKYYFVCMDELNVQAHLAEVSADGEVLSIAPITGDPQTNPDYRITFPSAASFIDNSFLVQGYNHIDKETILAIVTTDAIAGKSKNFSIGVGDTENVDKQITNHFLSTGRQLPFAVGKSGSSYYFNGFYDFTFSMSFTDLNQDDPSGSVQGQQENGGLGAILPLGSNKFATSIFNFGENFFLPNVIITPTDNSSSTTLAEDGLTFPELVPNAEVRIIRTEVNSKNALIFGSTTLSKQIGLFFYDEGTGVFMSSRYLGFSNPFQIASIIQTEDGGIAVCGTTYLAGRFPRICIFKISKEELAKNSK